jgi:REP element-mobilizing transposase RayT/type I restriction-modification system DNA methylase subunit
MALFQNSVLNNYLKRQNAEAITKAYKKFAKYFLDTTIQQNIRESKEEQFQEGFLRELFVTILGYTLNPHANFDLTTELKNEKGAKKADGAILQNNGLQPIAVAVIELKSTKTKDLESIRQQAFDYKANQTSCVYVITSNFEKLRFYVNNAVEFEEFDLFTLTQERFALLYLCLEKENLLQNIPLKIKEESIQVEEQITKKFYADYSLFKRELFRDLVKLNMKNEVFRTEFSKDDTERANKNIKHHLFKKSQKLIDRFLFIFFAEDRDLLPPNSTAKILEQWNKLKELDAYAPLYDRFKLYFNFLDTGRKGTDKTAEIFAYNGGLFKPDAILDSLLISDDLLYKHTKILSIYDFQSQVDVNILGHIFENSLNEIESVNAEIEGVEFDAQKTKRKKDGVFYTPKYITKYIVENTIGKLCTEKKTELNIQEEEYTKSRKGRTTAKLKELRDQLDQYRNWLLQLTICDPACGSGAFLNQALDFLIKEHQYIDELQTSLLGGGFVFPDIENTVLENNIFGVDLNEESVEIAKLSLWLRTAQPRRKLNDLSSNIKCGNSLIDDPKVAGSKAFKWEEEFPQIFKEKEKKAFHITTATHDSRTSQRMVDYKVRELRDSGLNPKAQPIWLEPEDEILITNTIAEIIKEDELNVMAYNICGDHIHLLLVCEEEEVTKIVGKIKGKTSRMYHSNKGINPLVQKGEEKSVPLWTQKFGCKEIEDEKQLWNTVEYIQNNRIKHDLPPLRDSNNKGINPLVERKRKDITKEINLLIPIEKNELFYRSYEHAFRTEYKGGFDVVIGNPPYVQIQSMGKIAIDLEKVGYKTYEKTGDLYCLFYELGNIILKNKGLMGYITSNKWMRGNYGKSLRNYFATETNPIVLIDLGSGIFTSATVDSNIIITQKQKVKEYNLLALDISKEKNFTDFSVYLKDAVYIKQLNDDIWTISDATLQQIENKVNKGKKLKNWDININYGVKTGYNEAFIISKEKRDELIRKDPKSAEILKPILRGRDIRKYNYDFADLYLIATLPSKNLNINEFKEVQSFLETFGRRIEQSGEKDCRKKTQNKWFETQDSISYWEKFEIPKIIYPETTVRRSEFVYDEEGIYLDKTCFFISGEKLKYINAILSSKLYEFYLENKLRLVGSTTIQYSKQYIVEVPIIEISKTEDFDHKVDTIITNHKNHRKLLNSFLQLLQTKFSIEKLTKKLENWYELEFGDFLKELEKARKNAITSATRGLNPLSKEKEYVPLSLQQEAEWMQYFNEQKQKAQTLKAEIDKTDKEIDKMVYELYGLSEEEIKIVEGI